MMKRRKITTQEQEHDYDFDRDYGGDGESI
jgi:hypothetical protein